MKLKELCGLSLVFAGLCSSCATVKVPNLEFCTELVDFSGFCTETLTAKSTDYPPEVWAVKKKEYRMMMSPENVGKILLFIDTTCLVTTKCVVE